MSRGPRDPAADRVHRLVAALRLPRPWNLVAFTVQVGELLGKPLQLMPIPGLVAAGLPCGVVLEQGDVIVIAYEADSSTYHLEHIVLHEVGHLLLDHTGCAAADATRHAIGSLFPGFDPDSVLRVLERSAYDDRDEAQAELFASLVMSESRRAVWVSPWGRTVFHD